jgi:deoxyribonucleoside regulator
MGLRETANNEMPIARTLSSELKIGARAERWVEKELLEVVRARGAVGEVISMYISLEGLVVPLELNERIVGLDFGEIRKIPLRVGVSWGAQKALANIGAARSGLVNVLITDENTAHEMLHHG